jgi:steroid 5-alpha reductase family enzyme
MTLASMLAGWTGIAVVMALLWWLQRARRNAGPVDVAWSFATAALGMWFAWIAPGYLPRSAIVIVMAGLWGVRLGSHILHRVTSETEDGRYQELRRQWGSRTQPRLFVFFQIQALWAVMFAAPMYAAAANPLPRLTVLDYAGIAVWIVAFAGESLADRQLSRFRQDPRNRGRVCRDGLWRYSRHPNYFFEWLHWWAYVALAAGSPLWWIAVAGVAMMLLFLTRVTGIPPTEAQALRSRGEAYREYQRTTSAFFPWPPRTAGAAR